MSNRPKSVLILGAGVNGAAIARESALNGVSVTIVDRADIACGATAASSRLIHGGLRYLEYGDFDLVRESLEERTRLLRLAPQFVRPLRLQIPVRKRFSGWTTALRRMLWRSGKVSCRGLWLVRTGLWLYDRYARDPVLPKHQVFSAGDADAIPVAESYGWLCAYWDAQMLFPERFVIALLHDARQAATQHGAHLEVFTYHEAKLAGRQVTIHRSGDPNQVTAELEPELIINATGAWVDDTLQQLHVQSPKLMGGTKGSHFVTHHVGLVDALGDSGVYVEADDGRPVFILPWNGAVLVGTTDIVFEQDPATAVCTDEELEYLVRAVNEVMPQIQLTRDDVAFHYSGVRPLPDSASSPGAITRRHRLDEHTGGQLPIFSVIGGKLTTCRSLAEQSAATILRRLGHAGPIESSRDRPLPGADAYPTDADELQNHLQRLADKHRVTMAECRAAWPLFGARTDEILSAISSSHSENLADTDFLEHLVRWVIENEWVTKLEDLIERRLMLLFDPRLSRNTLKRLARVLQESGNLEASDFEAHVESAAANLSRRFGKQLADTR